ncbi:DUF4190 domain-containing protein [Microbacterium sp. Mu-80]|uniref:DUF4190 domain-containing protein n=1 Tax=Microbacterium bandirmense TaxID=3122050 RepID=A0ABU8L8D3_9MICO
MSNQNDDGRYAAGYEAPVPPAPPQYLPPQPPAASPYAPSMPEQPTQSPYPTAQYPTAQYPVAPYAQPQHPYAQPAAPYAPVYTPVRPTNGSAVAALICGIVGLFISPFIVVFFIPLAVPVAAVILGHIARSQIKRAPHTGGSGMALTGLILGYIPIALSALGLVLVIIGFALFGTMMTMPGMMS